MFYLHTRRVLTVLALLVVLTLSSPLLIAPAQGPAGAEDLSLIDAFLAQQFETRDFPALAFVLVREGKVAFIVGYGQAVVEDDVPILHVCRPLCRAVRLLSQLLELAGIPSWMTRGLTAPRRGLRSLHGIA